MRAGVERAPRDPGRGRERAGGGGGRDAFGQEGAERGVRVEGQQEGGGAVGVAAAARGAPLACPRGEGSGGGGRRAGPGALDDDGDLALEGPGAAVCARRFSRVLSLASPSRLSVFVAVVDGSSREKGRAAAAAAPPLSPSLGPRGKHRGPFLEPSPPPLLVQLRQLPRHRDAPAGTEGEGRVGERGRERAGGDEGDDGGGDRRRRRRGCGAAPAAARARPAPSPCRRRELPQPPQPRPGLGGKEPHEEPVPGVEPAGGDRRRGGAGPWDGDDVEAGRGRGGGDAAAGVGDRGGAGVRHEGDGLAPGQPLEHRGRARRLVVGVEADEAGGGGRGRGARGRARCGGDGSGNERPAAPRVLAEDRVRRRQHPRGPRGEVLEVADGRGDDVEARGEARRG